MPTFTWDETAVEVPYRLTVDFHDGENPDVANLFPDVYDGVEDHCLLSGTLTDEEDVSVAVVGCPNNTTDPFDVIILINFFVLLL